MSAHECRWKEDFRHENDDRIRTRDYCQSFYCWLVRYGCFAKRGEDWGVVGNWSHVVRDPWNTAITGPS